MFEITPDTTIMTLPKYAYRVMRNAVVGWNIYMSRHM